MTSYDSDSDEADETTTQTYFSTKHALPPLDLSFKSLLTPEDIKEEIEAHYQKNLSRSQTTKKYTCNSVRINNNSLNEIKGIYVAIQEIVTNIDDIAWLDFSFNDINIIDDEILQFPNLKVLYLHGNAIEKIQDVRKLASLTDLRALTLHGNPIETEVGYRQFVLSILPWLKTLDFSAVTKQDLGTAVVWSNMNPKAFKRKRKSTEEEY